MMLWCILQTYVFTILRMNHQKWTNKSVVLCLLLYVTEMLMSALMKCDVCIPLTWHSCQKLKPVSVFVSLFLLCLSVAASPGPCWCPKETNELGRPPGASGTEVRPAAARLSAARLGHAGQQHAGRHQHYRQVLSHSFPSLVWRLQPRLLDRISHQRHHGVSVRGLIEW